MKLILSSIAVLMTTGIAHAGTLQVPEISAVAGLAAVGVVGAVMALVWERRRK